MKLLKILTLVLAYSLSASVFAKELPDNSYIHAKFQPSYTACINNSGGATFELQKCMDEEYRYHKQRVQLSFAKIIDRPDSVSKDQLMDKVANWWSDTEKYCTWDPKTEGQAQMLDAESCGLNRIANLADQLKNQ